MTTIVYARLRLPDLQKCTHKRQRNTTNVHHDHLEELFISVSWTFPAFDAQALEQAPLALALGLGVLNTDSVWTAVEHGEQQAIPSSFVVGQS